MVVPAVAADASAAKLSATTTQVGKLLDDPAANAVLKKLIPTVYANEMFQTSGRELTLKDIQQYEPENLSDANLAKIQAELDKSPRRSDVDRPALIHCQGRAGSLPASSASVAGDGAVHAFRRAVERFDRKVRRRVLKCRGIELPGEEPGVLQRNLHNQSLTGCIQMHALDGCQRSRVQEAARRLTGCFHILIEHTGRIIARFDHERLPLEVTDRVPQ